MQVIRVYLAIVSSLCMTGSGLAEDTAAPINVGSQKQLFIDGLFFASSENISLHMNPAVKTGEKTMESDRPWEDATLNWLTVMDDAGKYRMWYECYDVEGWPTPDDTSFCYAESVDGIRWTKPALGMFSYHGSTENNILFRQIGPDGARSRVHGTDVFVDPKAPSESRYKAISQGQFKNETPPYRVAGMESPDGIHWTRYAQPICDVFADSQYSGWWDARTGRYVMYGRVSGRGRSIGYAASEAFTHFEAPILVLEVEPAESPETDLYNPAAIQYSGAANVYLMFPSMYHHTPDTLDIGLAVSRDGEHWTRPGGATPFIAQGSSGGFDSGSLYMGHGMICKGGEIWQYFSGSRLKHNEAELAPLSKPGNKRVFSRAVSRLDGFVSAEAGNDAGIFTTPPMTFDGHALALNIAVHDGGEARVAVLDAAGAVLPGRSLQDCVVITGDHLDLRVTWTNGDAVPQGAAGPIRLQFAMNACSLYAFQFVQ